MPDWKEIVREKLGRLPLHNGRRDEIIEELAQQLESAYEEALAQGITEQEALRRSLAQFKDWEKLRSEVFHSVEGTRLPVWEQNGFFSPCRLPVWIALALALLLFAAPSFRQALVSIPVPNSMPTAWNSRAFSEKALGRIEKSGDKQKYARALAYVALHSPKEDDLRAMHAAEKAIALDPQLTWISAHVCHASYLVPGYDPHPWIERLKAWDPQNAFPYLLEASANVHYWEPPLAGFSATKNGLREALAAEPRWRVPMDKAFAAPRIDFYSAQQFALDRQVLRENGLDRPDLLALAAWSRQMPDVLAFNFYEDIQLSDIGEPAEKAGRTEEALAAYWSVAHFAEKLQSDPSMFTQIFSAKFREDAYKRILPVLRRAGRTSEAATVETALATLSLQDPRKKRLGTSAVQASAARSARVVVLSALFVLVFGIASALWLISVLALRYKAGLGRPLNRFASVLCLAPAGLLLASFTLFVAHYPYALSIGQFASEEDLSAAYHPFFMGLYNSANIGGLGDIWLARMFWPTIWCAAVALAGACLLWWVRSRPRRDHPDAA
jgi:hypothetical protein